MLLREIAEIRRTGIAFDDGEFNPEVRCIAVPVIDFTGDVDRRARAFPARSGACPTRLLQDHAKIVQAAANRLSAEFGASDADLPRILNKD